MTSNIIKCANCNVVINELLAFIQNKADVMDEISLSRICCDSFSDEEIVLSKKLLFESIPNSKQKTRRNKNKSVRDIDDIISLIKATDPEVVPTFVARELQKLPPITFDHIDATTLLKEIIVLKQNVKLLQEESARSAELSELRMEIENLKRSSIVNNHFDFVNKRRGACFIPNDSYNSGPMALQQISPKSSSANSSQNYNTNNENGFEGRQNNCLNSQDRDDLTKRTAGDVNHNISAGFVDACSAVSLSLSKEIGDESEEGPGELLTDQCNSNLAVGCSSASCSPTKRANSESGDATSTRSTLLRDNNSINARKSTAEILKACIDREQKVVDSHPWQECTIKKRKISTKGRLGKADIGPQGKFKAAAVMVPMFISNVSKETKDTDIKEYVKNRTQANINLFKINRKMEKSYNSFKLYIPKNVLNVVSEDTFWPDGITFRRFVQDKFNTRSGVLQQKSTKL